MKTNNIDYAPKYLVYGHLKGDHITVYQFKYSRGLEQYYEEINTEYDLAYITYHKILTYVKLNKQYGAYLEEFESLHDVQSKYFEYFL